MSTATNTAIVRRFEDAFAANDAATLDALCDPDLVDHNIFVVSPILT